MPYLFPRHLIPFEAYSNPLLSLPMAAYPPFHISILVFALLFGLIYPGCRAVASNWDTWWNYAVAGVSGPSYWGLINPKMWEMCAKGRLQSPIDIDPNRLLFDPNLKPMYIEKHPVTGWMENLGQVLVVYPNVTRATKPIIISGGPLGAYEYSLSEIRFHFGDHTSTGSEHTIGGKAFPAEIQAVGYNSKLYDNFQDAAKNPNGLVTLSVLLYVTSDTNALNGEIRRLGSLLPKVMYKGQTVPLEHISLPQLLPPTGQYVTYEGSLTSPGCFETVTWVVFNKPIYISQQDLNHLRDIHRTETKQDPPVRMADNFRPTQPLNKRTIRTNINFKYKTATDESRCRESSNEVYYRANPKFPWNISKSP